MRIVTLKEQVARIILDAMETSDLRKPSPEHWLLQTHISNLRFVLVPHPADEGGKGVDDAKSRHYKWFTGLTLPEGYSRRDYEEALDELFPHDADFISTDSNPETLRSYLGSDIATGRKISRKHLEDALAPYTSSLLSAQ